MRVLTLNKVIECRALRVQITNDDTIEVVYNDAVVIADEDIKNYLVALDYFYQFGKLKSLIVLGNDVEIDISARKLLMREKRERLDFIIAEAIVVTNFSQKILAEHYSVVNGTYYPIKVFNSRLAAEIWLKTI
jgi:hypothetical protein